MPLVFQDFIEEVLGVTAATNGTSFFSGDLAPQPQDWIVVLVDDTLFERDDGIVGNRDAFGTDLGAALCDVAQADAHFVPDDFGPVHVVDRMHFQSRHAHQKTRPAEANLLMMLAQYVADILTEKALDALAEFLDAVRLHLREIPVGIGFRLECRNVLVDFVVPGNVTERSLTTGNVFIGRIEIDSVESYLSMRSIHASRGFPSTSAPHEPHLPALQFQRQTRSGACIACTA